MLHQVESPDLVCAEHRATMSARDCKSIFHCGVVVVEIAITVRPVGAINSFFNLYLIEWGGAVVADVFRIRRFNDDSWRIGGGSAEIWVSMCVLL